MEKCNNESKLFYIYESKDWEQIKYGPNKLQHQNTRLKRNE